MSEREIYFFIFFNIVILIMGVLVCKFEDFVFEYTSTKQTNQVEQIQQENLQDNLGIVVDEANHLVNEQSKNQ